MSNSLRGETDEFLIAAGVCRTLGVDDEDACIARKAERTPHVGIARDLHHARKPDAPALT